MALVCEQCTGVFPVQQEPEAASKYTVTEYWGWRLADKPQPQPKSQETTADDPEVHFLPLRPVSQVLPGTAKCWVDAATSTTTPFDIPDDPQWESNSSRAYPSLKTPQTALVPDWSKVESGPLRLHHFKGGSPSVQFQPSGDWVEVAKCSFMRMTDRICCRPGVPSQGVIFRHSGTNTALVADGVPGTSVTVKKWWDFVYDDVMWCVCTNCSRWCDCETNLEGCYSSHFQFCCWHCCALMLVDILGEYTAAVSGNSHEDDKDDEEVLMYVADKRHLFLPAKKVAYVKSSLGHEDSEDSDSGDDEQHEGYLPCGSCIVNLPAVPYPAGTDLSCDGPTITVIFENGSKGCYSGD